MTRPICRLRGLALATVILMVSGFQSAHAVKLELPSSAPLLAQLAADILLYLHITGGALGILAGTVAILSRKGQSVHKLAGKIFFVSMFAAYAIGAAVAPFLETQQRPNFVAGILALYLLITAWLAARRRNPSVGIAEYSGLATALFVLVCGVFFIYEAASDPSGTVDGSPPQAFVLFVVVGTVAVLEDIYVLVRANIKAAFRISRHLWRMCMSMFIAGGAFFFGQEQLLPGWLVGTGWQLAFAVFPLVAMLVWLILQSLPGNFRRNHTG